MKRCITLLIALMLLCPAALAQSYTAQWGDWGTSQFGLINFMFNDEGEIIATNKEYCRLYTISSEHGWFSATLCERTPEGHHQPGGEALMDAEGNLLTGHIYSRFEAASANTIIAAQETPEYRPLYSVLNANGEVIVPPQEARIELLGNHFCYFKDESGQTVLTGIDGHRTKLAPHSMAGKFFHACCHIRSRIEKRLSRLQQQYTPSAGNVSIDSFAADNTHPGYGNCACSLFDTRYVLVDSNGNRILPGEYYLLIPLEGTAYYLFEDETGYGVLKPDGTALLYVDIGYNRHGPVWG